MQQMSKIIPGSSSKKCLELCRHQPYDQKWPNPSIIDASSVGLGTFLEQNEMIILYNKKQHSIGYSQRALHGCKKHCPQKEKGAVPVVLESDTFRTIYKPVHLWSSMIAIYLSPFSCSCPEIFSVHPKHDIDTNLRY